jgi:hypothetical protein
MTFMMERSCMGDGREFYDDEEVDTDRRIWHFVSVLGLLDEFTSVVNREIPQEESNKAESRPKALLNKLSGL